MLYRTLKADGFEALGRYDGMIAFVRRDSAMPPAVKDEQLARLNR